MARFFSWLSVIFLFFFAFFAKEFSSKQLLADTSTIPLFTSQSTISIGWVGDMVPASDPAYNQTALDNVSSALSTPNLMIGNLEGTFALPERSSKCSYLKTMCHAFRGDPIFADSLKASGFDVVSLVNNHSYDYGTEGLYDTQKELDRVGIPYITPEKPTISITVNGKKIGIVGLSSTEPTQTITDYEFIKNTVTSLKETNDIVIVIFHGGAEGSDKTIVPGTDEFMGTENRGNVELVAHTAIDYGADLVLGSGPHVLRKIEYYKGGVIAYSMGNFVGGNERLVTKGTLALSGIFTAEIANKKITNSFQSVLLSKNGIPSSDLTDQAKQLINSL